MAIKNGLRTLLLAQSSITELAPAQTIGRVSVPAIFVDKVKQGFKPPYIVISRISSDALGTLSNTTGIRQTEIDIDCFEYTEPLAEALATAVSDFLKDYTGGAGASDVIDAVQWVETQDFQNNEDDGSDAWRHAVTLTFEIHHH